MSLRSLFDGWVRKVNGIRSNYTRQGAEYCAMGWMDYQASHGGLADSESRTQIEHRLASYIRAHYPPIKFDPWNGHPSWIEADKDDISVICAFNNCTSVTPQQFAQIDLISRGVLPDTPENMPEVRVLADNEMVGPVPKHHFK